MALNFIKLLNQKIQKELVKEDELNKILECYAFSDKAIKINSSFEQKVLKEENKS